LPEETTGLSAEWSAITGFSATPVIP
jgi:hypothetical protein